MTGTRRGAAAEAGPPDRHAGPAHAGVVTGSPGRPAAPGAASGPRRILFVELLGGLGDVAIALPALQALARSHPLARCEALCFAPGAELLRHDPHVAAVHLAERGRAREAVERMLDRGRYDLVVSTTDTDGIGALIAARAPRAVTDLWRDPPADQRVEERLVALLTADGLVHPEAAGPGRLFLTDGERARARARLAPPGGPFAALLIDAGMAIKRWPEERVTALGRALRERHGLHPVVVGGAERGAAERVAGAIGGARALPPMPLRDLAAALTRCAVAVGADTGPLRLAALVGTPSLMLFGPSSAGRYGLGSGHAALQARPACPERRVDFTAQPCWWSGACPLPTGPASCMGDLGAPEAEAALAALLAPLPAGGAASEGLPGGARDGPSPGRPAAAPRRGAPALRAADWASDWASDWAADWAADWADARRILVARLDNIGDVIMTGPTLRAIRLSRPGVRLGLWASPSGAQAEPLLPWTDEVLSDRALWQELGSPPFEPSREAALIGRLREGRWDAAVILTSFSQSPHPAAWACRRAGIALVAGASDERGHALTHRWPKGERALHQAERNLALVRALGFGRGGPAMALAVPEAARAAARAHLAGGRSADDRGPGGHLLLSPWASASARQYEPARMAEAARRIAQAQGLRVVLTGAPGERARGADLARRIGRAALDLTGRTSVPEAAALVEGARLVLCCNSSAMHMAEALGVPAIILFAGTELASQWAPRATPHHLLARPVACAPCHAFDCPMERHACLDVDPAEVAAAADALLSGAAPAARARGAKRADADDPAPPGPPRPARAQAPGRRADEAAPSGPARTGTP